MIPVKAIVKTLLFTIYISVFISCKKQDIEQTQIKFDYNYFPLDSGAWRQYAVSQIVVDDATNIRDTSVYQLKEVNSGWILNASGNSVMRIERFVRSNNNDKWKINSVWQAGIDNRNAFQIEENVKYIKLKFPIKVNRSWNGNAYNNIDTLSNYRYNIESLDILDSVNNIIFDSVLKVIQKDKTSIIDKVYFFEKYAYGVGLIEKQQIDIYSTDVDPSIPIEDRVTKGVLYYCKLTDYGEN